MKIKLSKSQWEEIGTKAGWKTSGHYDYPQRCHECGNNFSKDQIEKVLGHKVCKGCAQRIINGIK